MSREITSTSWMRRLVTCFFCFTYTRNQFPTLPTSVAPQPRLRRTNKRLTTLILSITLTPTSTSTAKELHRSPTASNNRAPIVTTVETTTTSGISYPHPPTEFSLKPSYSSSPHNVPHEPLNDTQQQTLETSHLLTPHSSSPTSRPPLHFQKCVLRKIFG